MGAILQSNGVKKPLGTHTLVIGKKPDNQMIIKEAANYHAEIRFINQQYCIVDLGSLNGTFVNGQKLRPRNQRVLTYGDTIRIGGTTLTYKKNTSEGSGCGVLLLVALIIGVGVAISQGIPTPEKTLSAYCDALQSKDYQTAYNQLATSLQSKETEKQFTANLQQTMTKRGGLKGCLVGPVQASDATATSTLTLTFAHGTPYKVLVTLNSENSTWEIQRITL